MYGITEKRESRNEGFKAFRLDNLFLQCENIQNFFIETVVRQMFQSLISGKFLWKDFV